VEAMGGAGAAEHRLGQPDGCGVLRASWRARRSTRCTTAGLPEVTISQVVGAVPFTKSFLDRVAEGLNDLG
jgi:hypothetical protein